jgi:hypothetical protein
VLVDGYTDMNTDISIERPSEREQAARSILSRVAILLRQGRVEAALAEIPFTEIEEQEMGPR